MRALVLLLPIAAVAAPVAVKDDRGRAAVTVPHHTESVDHAKMHALPVGAGAAADGSAWLRIDVPGCYTVHNAEVIGWSEGKGCSPANRIWFVRPHKGPLVWTPPNGKQGPVPAENLIAAKPEDRKK